MVYLIIKAAISGVVVMAGSEIAKRSPTYAAVGVFGTGTGWPDIVVATIMAALALQGAWLVVSQSKAELRISASPA